MFYHGRKRVLSEKLTHEGVGFFSVIANFRKGGGGAVRFRLGVGYFKSPIQKEVNGG